MLREAGVEMGDEEDLRYGTVLVFGVENTSRMRR